MRGKPSIVMIAGVFVLTLLTGGHVFANGTMTIDFSGSPATGPFTAADFIGEAGPDENCDVGNKDRARIIDEEYQSLGVHFSNSTVGPGEVLLNVSIVSECPSSAGNFQIPMTIAFDAPQTAVVFDIFTNIYCIGTEVPAVLFDEVGNPFSAMVLGTVYGWNRIELSGLGTSIGAIQLGLTNCTSAGKTGSFSIDNLTFRPSGIAGILVDVNDFISSGNITGGAVRQLGSTIQRAFDYLVDGDIVQAARTLESFSQQVSSAIRRGQITGSEGQILLEETEQTLGDLTGA